MYFKKQVLFWTFFSLICAIITIVFIVYNHCKLEVIKSHFPANSRLLLLA